ncbi:uncharacterized protein LOC127857871 isoform X1 [Dreissena polymorpha]|nr:uncharacterized protein LOC127857871 isoform X1 [Dreissena polymorpha]
MERNGLRFAFNIGILLLFYLNVIDSDKPEDTLEARFPDKAFPSGMMIYNKTIECSVDHQPGQFPAQTWTCKDMRVGGLRLAYGYNEAILKDNDKCKETGGRNELAEICRQMMDRIGSKKELWAAFVTNATCGRLDEKRFLLNMTGVNQYSWDQMNPGYGWIYTLRCMAVK